jgi:hypothetical protein
MVGLKIRRGVGEAYDNMSGDSRWLWWAADMHHLDVSVGGGHVDLFADLKTGFQGAGSPHGCCHWSGNGVNAMQKSGKLGVGVGVCVCRMLYVDGSTATRHFTGLGLFKLHRPLMEYRVGSCIRHP